MGILGTPVLRRRHRAHHQWQGYHPLVAVVVGVLLISLVPSAAVAHPDHGSGSPGRGGAGSAELFPGEGIAPSGKQQHTGDTEHLPPVHTGAVELIGKGEVTNPSGAGNTGRIADVTAHGDYAYLNAFREPTCEAGGVHVMDIADPANPVEVPEAFIPTSPGSYAGEGIQILTLDTPHFSGDLLVHQNETCDPDQIVEPAKQGGISLWDVSDPRSPQPITLHTGDFTAEDGSLNPSPNQSHSMRVWNNVFDKRTYAVLVDNEEATDVDILDITNPYEPLMINDTLDLIELFGVDQDSPAGLDQIFHHDVDVYLLGQRYVMNVNYWDGGYVLLDVTDPRPGEVTLIAQSDYAEFDEQRLARGHRIAPEGNAHQSELSPDHRYLIGTDEDFDPYRVFLTIDTGRYAGTEHTAAQANGTPPIDSAEPLPISTSYVGLACEPLPAGSGTALIERGECPFQVKLDMITDAGYTAGIVFNAPVDGCAALVGMQASAGIPFLFVSRLAGLRLLDVPEVSEQNACDTAVPDAAGQGQDASIRAELSGWGYVRLFATDIPEHRNCPGSIRQIDTYAVPESQDPAYATGFGILSVHEVAMDPDTQGVAYLSYYAAGLRVVEYGDDGLTEVASFIDEGGNNFWGVEVWYDSTGQKYILASDRDFGLYVFRYPPAD